MWNGSPVLLTRCLEYLQYTYSWTPYPSVSILIRHPLLVAWDLRQLLNRGPVTYPHAYSVVSKSKDTHTSKKWEQALPAKDSFPSFSHGGLLTPEKVLSSNGLDAFSIREDQAYG